MATCVYLAPGQSSPDPALLGGKGAGAARLISAQLPVPPAAVITTEAYRACVASRELARLIDAIRAGAEVPAAEVDAAFLAAPVPTALEKEIVAIAQRVGEDQLVAVRSSATVEDLQAASFAGQYRSVLNVMPAEVMHAVRLVWASLWHPAPRAYRRAQAMSEQLAEMAVLVMRMVPAVRAGVVFSVDPGSFESEVRIEAVDGLGEALVSGAVRPDTWVARRPAVREALVDAPPPVARVAEMALDIERLFGGPQDIEWAWDGHRLWVVQARPITVAAGRGDGFDTALDDAELTTAGIAETLPGVLPPLVWDLASLCVEEGLRRVLDDVSALDDAAATASFVRRVRGRAALAVDLLKRATRRLPEGTEAEIERQYFGSEAPPIAGTASRAGPWRRIRSLGHDLRVMRARRRSVQEAETVIVAAAAIADSPPDLEPFDLPALLVYRSRLIDLGLRAAAAELGVAAGAAASYDRLEAMLRRHLGAEPAQRWAQYLTTGASVVSVTPGASMAVFAGPTWSECGVPVPDLAVQRFAVTEERHSIGALEAVLTGLPHWRRLRLLTGQLVDVRIHVLRRLAGDAAGMLRRREMAKAAVLSIGGEVRRIHLAIGERLVDNGVVADPHDVDLLRDLELRGQANAPSPAELRRRGRWLRLYADDGPLPERFVGYPLPLPPITAQGDVLTGTGGSAGRYTGMARLVHSPSGDFETGAVLVAESTDASWSPLFLRAGAVVVAQGGPLSHAAIVARELGLPAVVGLTAGVRGLDGHRVTVDGDRGTVTIHGELSADSAGAAPRPEGVTR